MRVNIHLATGFNVEFLMRFTLSEMKILGLISKLAIISATSYQT